MLFVVDASGSMGAQRRMVAVKGAVMSLLLDAYQRRDRVGGDLISWHQRLAIVTAHQQRRPRSSTPPGDANRRTTPLSSGLFKALEIIESERIKDRM
ncbi:MAG: hypothetical protein CM1200mP27_07000 [Chloroflexota bacterium]|nr:MAG: hypothetical protein CM1200mP27_07000 [Chloroflexota bacterium]